MFKFVKLLVTVISAGLVLQMVSGTAMASKKQIFGLHESVYVADFDIDLEAKLDTGAYTSSISATHIEEYEHDGEDWVRFKLAFKGAPKKVFSMPIARTSKVKRRADDYDPKKEKTYTARPVIELEVTLGDETKTIEVSLADRTRFKYPFLFGAKALREFHAVVDPSIRFTVDTTED